MQGRVRKMQEHKEKQIHKSYLNVYKLKQWTDATQQH